MARIAAPRPGSSTAGAYEAVRAKLMECLRTRPDHAAWLQCLEAMSVGAPVRVVDNFLPDTVKASAGYSAAKHCVGRLGHRFVRTDLVAVVYADGRISYDETVFDGMAEFMHADYVDWRDL